uniref:Proton-coupled folate transporter-like n=1 Tax=Diabrotica virgifera virgifera TaxID=50390 RepID=A0A6P7EZE6_DIAVI
MLRKINFPVEIPLFCCIYSQILLGTISSNLYIYRTCYVTLGYDKSDCAQLGRETNNMTKNLETLVQPTVNEIDMASNLSQTFIPLIMNLFIGSWSDKYGRKPFLVISLIGLALTSILMTIFAYFENLSPWIFLISSIPSMFTGAFSATFITINLYIADITTPETRVFRYGIYQAVMALASLIGNLSGSYLFYATSYVAVFSVATALLAISVFYTIFLLPESLDVERRVPKIKDLIKMMNIMDTFSITFKERESNKRKSLTIILILIIGFNFIYYGDLAVRVLFLREKIQWTLTEITYGNSFASVVYIFCMIFGTTILYKKLNEMHLCMLAIFSMGLSSLLKGLAQNGIYIYAGFAVEGFVGLGTSMLRTILTYILPSNELGKVYMTSSALDGIFCLVASSALYPAIYGATLTTYPGSFFFLDVAINSAMAVLLLYLMRHPIPRNSEPEKEDLGKVNKIESDIIFNTKDIEKF